MKGKVLVLNGNYEPLNITTVRRAVILVFVGKAEIVVPHDGEILRGEKVEIPVPSVVRLARYVRFRTKEIPLTKRNILKRDGYRCQYCGTAHGPMTVDHVIPKRLGGEDSWENLVAACFKCNNRKGDRTPEEAGMKLLSRPRKPNYFIFHFAQELPDERWKPFLFLK